MLLPNQIITKHVLFLCAVMDDFSRYIHLVCLYLQLLQEQGVCMRTTAEMEIVREMKEKCCHVAFNYETELAQGKSSCGEMHYTMPDGQVVTLSTERFR